MVYKGKLPEYIRSYPAHWHREMEIIYIVRGKGIVTVQTNQYVVDEGDIVIVAPEVIHSIKQFENYAMKYYNILFDFRLLENNSSHCYEKYLRGVYEHTQVLPTHLKKEDKLANSLKPYLQYLIENRKNKLAIDTDIIIPTDYLALPTVEDMKKYGFSLAPSSSHTPFGRAGVGILSTISFQTRRFG